VFIRRMARLRRALTARAFGGTAAVLAVLVMAFCLSSLTPAMAGDAGCQVPEPSARICGQSGDPHSISVAVQDVAPVLGASASTAWPPVASLPVVVSQFHAGPSTPRAPPFFLA
jgi:hypothetical protein